VSAFSYTPVHRVRRRGAVVAALAVTLAAASADRSAADTPISTAGTHSGAVVSTLSNLRTMSRWAYPQAAAAAHSSPSPRSRVIGHLEFLTPDGQAAVYLALRSYEIHGRTWILVPLPGRPNGVVGWVPAGALGELHTIREYLRVNRETFHATLLRAGRVLFSAPIGVGRPSLPTPLGHFYVTEKLTTVEDPLYGPYALGTSAYAPTLSEWPGGGVVGIHGTNEPQLIPGRPSHGCIRLRNADIARLWHMIAVGTPVEIV